jgi:HAD superfamily hydrolase (TIGR01509 family)
MSFAAVIFDLDGTLVDSEAITHAAGLFAFAAQGVAVDPAFLHALAGIDDATGAARIRAAYPVLDPARFARDWEGEVRARQATGIPLKPFALDVLTALPHPKALATSSKRTSAHRKLAVTGLARHFPHVVTFDDVTLPKPAPEPFLLAAALLGVDPATCLVFEDSDTGAEAANRAGMTVVQVPDIAQITGRFAHHVAPDLLAGARMAGII